MNYAKIILGTAIIALLSACGGGGEPAESSVKSSRSLASVTTSDYRSLVQQLYVAYFGRPADTGGFDNFQRQLAEIGGPTNMQALVQAYKTDTRIKSLVDSFGSSAESAALYGGDNTAFVTAIYQNVLGRAPDDEGLKFWVGAINRGELSRARASLDILAGALANSTAQGLLDAALVNKKVTVALNFTNALAGTPVDTYSGDNAAAQARSLLASVTASTDTAAFQSSISSLISILATESYEYLVQQLHIAFFERPADPAGLALQIQSLRAASAPKTIIELSGAYASNAAVRDLVDNLAYSLESNRLYNGPTYLGRYVYAAYNTAFSHAPNAADAAHWDSLLQDGHSTRPSVLLAILASAKGSDADLFARKVQAASLFTRTLDAAGQRAIYDDPVARLVARAMIHSVPSMPNDSAMQASIDATIHRLSALATGSFVEAASGVHKVLLLASAEQMASNGNRVSALADALTSDLNQLRPGGTTWTVTIMTAAGTVAAIRDQLRSYHSAILIGRVPVATARGAPQMDLYRLPDCPLLAVDNTGAVSSFSWDGIDPRCKNGLVISVLRGQSPQTDLDDVGRKLDQMIAYHKASSAMNTSWARRLRYVQAAWAGGLDTHMRGMSDAWAGLTMFAQDAISYLDDGSGAQRRDAFVDCITHNNEICGANLHGAPREIQFESPGTPGVFYSSESVSWWPKDLAAQSVQAKYIALDSCSTQNFLVDQSVGTTLLMNGKSLLTRGNVETTFISQDNEADTIRNEYALLQNGSTFAEVLSGRMETSPGNIQGDPYITMRPMPLGPQPKLVIDGIHYNSAVAAHQIKLPDSVNGSKLIQVVTYSNRGDADLHLRIGVVPIRIGVDTGSSQGFEQFDDEDAGYTVIAIEYVQTFSDGRVLTPPAIETETYDGVMHATLKPGQSVAVTHRMNVPVNADGKPQRPGQYVWDQVSTTSDDPASGRVDISMTARVR